MKVNQLRQHHSHGRRNGGNVPIGLTQGGAPSLQIPHACVGPEQGAPTRAVARAAAGSPLRAVHEPRKHLVVH
eukprot:8227259-Alexandrium_andersonii.AAC.1